MTAGLGHHSSKQAGSARLENLQPESQTTKIMTIQLSGGTRYKPAGLHILGKICFCCWGCVRKNKSSVLSPALIWEFSQLVIGALTPLHTLQGVRLLFLFLKGLRRKLLFLAGTCHASEKKFK